MGRIVTIPNVSIAAMSPLAWPGCGVRAGDNEATATDNPPCSNIRLGRLRRLGLRN
jgi:hypothetical protein